MHKISQLNILIFNNELHQQPLITARVVAPKKRKQQT